MNKLPYILIGLFLPLLSANEEIYQWIENLSDSKKQPQAMASLVAKEKVSIPFLLGEATEGNDLVRRGWSFVCLAEIGDGSITSKLTNIANDNNQSMLVRTWALATQVKLSQTFQELAKLGSMVTQFPALKRPIGKRAMELIHQDNNLSVEQMIKISLNIPQIQSSLHSAIMAQGAESLSNVMISGATDPIRYQAAAYLGTLATRGDTTFIPQMVTKYQFQAKASQTPWEGGALYVPSLNWDKENARQLVRNLLSWYIWAEVNEKNNHKNQIHNNIRSINLARAAGYQSPGWGAVSVEKWLITWGKAVGKADVQEMLQEQGVLERYKNVLAQIK